MAETLQLKLSYFDFDGGRGEPARIALSLGNIPFEDDRLAGRAWASLKPEAPFGGLPILTVNGVRITQSNSINRYVGKLAGLYPSDPLQALYADEAMDAVESLYAALQPSFGIEDLEARKAARTQLLETSVGQHLRGIAGLLARSGGEWFADGRLTVADLKVSGLIRHLSAGILDGIPKDAVRHLAPTLATFHERVQSDPGVVAYYARRAAAKAAQS